MLYRARIVVESYSNRARIAIVISPLARTLLKTGLWAMYICCFLFLTIPVRPIISKSIEPISAKFSGMVKLWLYMISLKLVFDPSRDVAMTANANF